MFGFTIFETLVLIFAGITAAAAVLTSIGTWVGTWSHLRQEKIIQERVDFPLWDQELDDI